MISAPSVLHAEQAKLRTCNLIAVLVQRGCDTLLTHAAQAFEQRRHRGCLTRSLRWSVDLNCGRRGTKLFVELWTKRC